MAMQLLEWVRALRRLPPERTGDDALALEPLTAQIEDGLRSIEFDEVTDADRATFVEHAVVWQVRRALRSSRFDLALQLQRWGVERIASLERGCRMPFRPRIVPRRGS